MVGLKLPKKKHMSLEKKLGIYNNVKEVCIPLISSSDTNIEPLVKVGDYVYKGTVIGRRTGNFSTPIFSSISGYVISFKEVDNQLKKKIKSVVIENDFKEAINLDQVIRKDINKIKKDEFVEILKNCGIIGMGGAGYPTYAKYNQDIKINTLIINAVECEPYITADHALIKEKCEEILEAIDAILEINDIPEAIIVVKKTNTEVINLINEYMGSYLKIKLELVANRYPMGWERLIIKDVKKISYDRFPGEKGIIVNNVSTIYAISQAIKYNKPLIERIVTFTGEGLNNKQNVLVKVGTPVKDVIEYIGGKKSNTIIVTGGPMMGDVADDDLVVTADLNCVIVLEDNKIEKRKECLGCGKCIEVCPMKLCPVLIKNNLNNESELNKLHPEKCIACGLCSFVCPSKIEVREFVKAGKVKVGENK